MADENKTPDTPPPAENLADLKADMEKKFSALSAQLAEAVKKTAPTPAPKQDAAPPVPKKPISTRFYEDEEATLNEVKEQTKKEMREEINASQREVAVINKLAQDFPELTDKDHAFTKRAVEIFEGFSAEDKKNPSSYRVAVLDAAMELDVLPMKKRKKETTDEYTGGGGGGTGNAGGSRNAKGLDPRTVEFARLMGLNMDDEKQADRLKDRAARTNWTSYR